MAPLSTVYEAYDVPNFVLTASQKIAVFRQQDATGTYTIYGSVWRSGSGWSALTTLSSATRNAIGVPVVAKNSTDDVIIVWSALDNSAGIYFIEAVTYSASFPGGWGTTTSVTDGTDNPCFGDYRVAIDDSGNIALIWSSVNSSAARSIKETSALFSMSPTWNSQTFIASGSGVQVP